MVVLVLDSGKLLVNGYHLYCDKRLQSPIIACDDMSGNCCPEYILTTGSDTVFQAQASYRHTTLIVRESEDGG